RPIVERTVGFERSLTQDPVADEPARSVRSDRALVLRQSPQLDHVEIEGLEAPTQDREDRVAAEAVAPVVVLADEHVQGADTVARSELVEPDLPIARPLASAMTNGWPSCVAR